jgi:hypothetical protein
MLKAAIVEAAPATNGVVSKADLKRALRIVGFSSPIYSGGKPAPTEMQIDLVKVGMDKQDIRARAKFPAGSWFEVILEFGMPLSPSSVMAAVETAGACVGIGEWRPERGGELGTFHVEGLKGDAATIRRVIQACSVPEEVFVIPPEMLQAMVNVKISEQSDPVRKAVAVSKHVNGQGKRSHANA